MSAAPIPRPSGGISSAHAPDLDIPARFMAIAMFGMLITAIIGVVAYPLLLESFYAPKLLAFVHLHTLGIVAPLVIGASYQLVPVVLQEPLAAPRAARFSFWVYLFGVVLFLPSLITTWQVGLGIGGTLLFTALIMYATIVWLTLESAPERGVVRWHIAASVIGLPLGVAAGLLLALNKTTGFLAGHTLSLLAAHATLMILCWITPLLFGVAYRLVGMFTLSEDRLWHRVAWSELVFTLLGGWSLAGAFLFFHSRPVFIASSAFVLIGQGLFFAQLAHMYHARRRRQIDVHIPFALTAASAGVLAGLTLFIGFIRGGEPANELWVLATWLGIAGMMITAIQGFFYKIATFLVWLNRYAPVAGRQRVPRLEELYRLRIARIGWICWLAALVTSASGILFRVEPLVSAGGLLAAGGLGCFLSNVVQIAGHWQSGPVNRVLGRMSRSRRAAVGERVGHVIAGK